MTAGLTAVHKQKLVYRDIKPSNIMLSLEDGGGVTPKIIDLGLAKAVNEPGSQTAISMPGGFAGTPEFASPEQFAGVGVDIRSDLYSLGVVLWEMLTGHAVFRGSPAEVMYQHQHAPLPLFPTNHWRESRMPWRSPTMPLRWHADYAHHLAAAWTVQLNRNLRAYRKLWAVFGIQITGITPTGSFGAPFSVSFSRNVPFKGPFWFILWAAGFGEETCTVKGPTSVYRGFPFWSAYPYGLPNLGLGSNTSSKVLIAGRGDGALQDFLRITTGYQSAKDIYDHCNFPEEVRKEIQEEIYSAEDQARRAGTWSAHTRHDHDVQMQLQAANVTAVTNALNQPDVEKALAKLLKGGACL